ncbi:DMT family transporter [Microvirga roseola]|uniref:DMT family transporter n=1 Tax=Microvirga roseola TaxID=2883126 RepID=UPI002AC35B57|nr:DMT family transporter [Microvirga roseola]
MFFVCFVWAAHTVLSKIVVSGMEIPPLFYAAIRFGIVGLVTLPWLLPAPRPTWRMLLVGFLMGGGGFALFFLGIKSASPSSAAVVSQLGLPITTLLSVAMLGERIHWRRGLGIALTFTGGMLVMWDPGSGFPLSGGLVLILLSTAAGSLAAVMMKQIKGVRPLQFQAWIGLASVVPLILLTASLETGQAAQAMKAGWAFVAALLFSALIVSLVAHTIYYGLIGKYPANLIAPLTIMTPLLTVAMGIVVTGDRFDTRMALGTGLALCGVLIIALRRNHVMPLATVLWGGLGERIAYALTPLPQKDVDGRDDPRIKSGDGHDGGRCQDEKRAGRSAPWR